MANINLSAKQMRAVTQTQNVYTISGAAGSQTNPFSNIGAQLSPLTISGSGLNIGSNNSTINISAMFSDNEFYKKYEIIESTEDLLVLSCVWYRLRQERNANKSIGVNPTKLVDRVLFQNIHEEDRELAGKIRDYYSKKIMMLKLKSVPFTKYRNDLNHFIHSDGMKFEESICGLVYRLPEFYQYDIEFDEMISECKREVQPKQSRATHTLKHIGTLRVNKRTSKKVEYWFKNENDEIANITIEPHNPLLKVWDKLVFDDLKIEAKYLVKLRDGMSYYVLNDYTLA